MNPIHQYIKERNNEFKKEIKEVDYEANRAQLQAFHSASMSGLLQRIREQWEQLEESIEGLEADVSILDEIYQFAFFLEAPSKEDPPK